MKTPSDPNEPLLRSLAEEAADLPLKAAMEVRKTRSLRMKKRRQVALTITVLFVAVCTWRLFPERGTEPGSLAVHLPPDAPMQKAPFSAQPGNHVIVRTEEQARNEPLPLPDGLTVEQANVLKAARGLPLLIVHDSEGKVARIHVIER